MTAGVARAEDMRNLRAKLARAQGMQEAERYRRERVEQKLDRRNQRIRELEAEVKRLRAELEPSDEPPCDAETHSWDHYSPNAVDSYWIGCDRTGPHDEHEDQSTGLTWKDAP